MSTSKFVDVENTRTAEQRRVYEEIEAQGIDPFSEEHFKTHHPYPILCDNNDWFVTHNAFPYKGMSLHLLIVHKQFITSITEISSDGWKSFYELIQVISQKFNLSSGGLFMRFGDTKKTGGTVTHLHAHIMVTDGGSDDRRTMYVISNPV
jgi:diadenosine tetraphosphate (Ap4A) HIT family hydrolase